LSPNDKTSLCVELFSSLEGDLWQREDDAIVSLVTEEMKGIGLLDPSSVLESKVLRVPHTHPVYRVGFQRHFAVIDDFIRRELSNFHLLGRTGAFQYKNMDQVMMDGYQLGERLSPDPQANRNF
jgi:protoporphyrinogen oxidase